MGIQVNKKPSSQEYIQRIFNDFNLRNKTDCLSQVQVFEKSQVTLIYKDH